MSGLLAQSSDPEVLVLLILLVILAALAFIPASIAGKKGYSAEAFFLFGLLLFVPALIVALLIQDKRQTGLPALPGRATSSSSGAITWTHSGHRYLLGYTVAANPYYGIWDRNQPGQPSMRFPYTDHGKNESQVRFKELEPQAVPVSQGTMPPAPPDAGPTSPEAPPPMAPF